MIIVAMAILCIAVVVLGIGLVFSVVSGKKQMRKLEQKVNSIGNCLLTYITHPESIDVVKEYDVNSSSDFSFPNSEGF